jgi:hypothetical protein
MVGWFCIAKCDKAFSGAGWQGIVPSVRSFLMQNFLAFAVLSGSLTVLGWSFVAQPLPPDNPQAYQQCIKLHPQRYCTLEHMPSKLETMAKK